jgi:hypothetical protein
MASSGILLFSICAVAILFWLRFIYLNSLKNAERRDAFKKATLKMLLYIPAGLQGIFLFSYIMFSPFMMATFPRMVLGNPSGRDSEFISHLLPSGAIIAGSLVLTFNLFLAAKAQTVNGAAGLLLKVMVFAAGAGFFLLLRQNLAGDFVSVSFSKSGVIYNSSFVLILSLLIIIIFSFLKNAWVRNRDSIFLKYFSLSSKMLLCYISVSSIAKFIFSLAFR